MCRSRCVTLRMRTAPTQVQRSLSLVAAVTGDGTSISILTPDSGPSQMFREISSPKMTFFSPTMV